MDNLSKQLESPESQQMLPSPSHSFVLKKQERTPEEGSKAVCRTALIAAIDSTSHIPKTVTFVSPVKTEVRSPASHDKMIVNISCSPPKPENKSEDNSNSFWVLEDIKAQGDHSEPRTDGRVSQLTHSNLSFHLGFFACV